jgi:hypothetical protein
MGCFTNYLALLIILFGGVVFIHLFYIYPELLKNAKNKVPYNQKMQLPSWYRNYIDL